MLYRSKLSAYINPCFIGRQCEKCSWDIIGSELLKSGSKWVAQAVSRTETLLWPCSDRIVLAGPRGHQGRRSLCKAATTHINTEAVSGRKEGMERKAMYWNLWYKHTFCHYIGQLKKRVCIRELQDLPVPRNIISRPSITRGPNFTVSPEDKRWKSSDSSKKPGRDHVPMYFWNSSGFFDQCLGLGLSCNTDIAMKSQLGN